MLSTGQRSSKKTDETFSCWIFRIGGIRVPSLFAAICRHEQLENTTIWHQRSICDAYLHASGTLHVCGTIIRGFWILKVMTAIQAKSVPTYSEELNLQANNGTCLYHSSVSQENGWIACCQGAVPKGREVYLTVIFPCSTTWVVVFRSFIDLSLAILHLSPQNLARMVKAVVLGAAGELIVFIFQVVYQFLTYLQAVLGNP